MSIWDIHSVGGKVSKSSVRPKLFLWDIVDFTSCRCDMIPPNLIPCPQQPHENIIRILTMKMVDNVN